MLVGGDRWLMSQLHC